MSPSIKSMSFSQLLARVKENRHKHNDIRRFNTKAEMNSRLVECADTEMFVPGAMYFGEEGIESILSIAEDNDNTTTIGEIKKQLNVTKILKVK